MKSFGLRYAAFAFCLSPILGAAAPMEPGIHTGVVLTQASPLASNAEILRRALTPLTAQRIAAAGSIAGQPIDIAHESFVITVPAHKPSEGYALLVFVPPWDDAKVPAGWLSVLDDKGVIFVSADRSSNETKVESRRMPLAVTAAEQLMRDYSIEPSRVLVGGFSGGSRVAMRLALAYPDVFRGALLNSDADPIGSAVSPLPPADLLHRFQEKSRLYFVTGENDTIARVMQSATEVSLQKWCFFDVHAATMTHAGHTTADGRTLSEALEVLLDPAPAKRDGLAECRARNQSELDSDVQHIEALVAGGDKTSAREALSDLDANYGNLAAPEILALAKKLK